MSIMSSFLPFLPILVIGFIVVLILASGYVKAPPNIAYIISGPRKNPKILIGKAGIRIPFFERLDKLIVKQVSVDIKTNGYIPTKDFIGVRVDAVAKIQMDIENGTDAAIKNFLNMNEEEIISALTDSLQGNMREIIGTIELKQICTDKEMFGNQLQEKAQRDMSALGIKILSCNIQNVEDENGLINALGQDNMSQIQKEATIAKANADKEVEIATSKAKQEANIVRVTAENAIAEQNNELEIKRANLKTEADKRKASADASYLIQEQLERKQIEIAGADANIAKQEKEIELKKKEVEVKEQLLDAEVRKAAEADRYAREQKAEASLYERQKSADAEYFEKQKTIEAKKLQAEADLYAKEKEAAGVQALGEAEARSIEAKGLAEAEALSKKAEAMKKYGEAAILELIVNKLPEMARAIAEPLAAIDKVTIIDSGNGETGVSSMGQYVPQLLSKTIETMKETTGFDMLEVMKASTYDAKVSKNINITGLENMGDSSKEDIATAIVSTSVVEND